MANETMETLLQKMSELTTAIQGKEKNELRWDDVKADFELKFKDLVIL